MNPAVAAIIEQAHRELAKIPELDARIAVHAEMIDNLVTAGRFLKEEKKRRKREATQIAADAKAIKAEERAIAKGWLTERKTA